MDRIQEINKQLIEEYPFIWPNDYWTLKPLKTCDYSYTLLDDIPPGWKEAFGLDLCKEIKEQLIKENKLDSYRVIQVKEKFGGLRWYDAEHSAELKEIIRKYAELSYNTCVDCGAPATYMSTGWICPYCDDCAHTIAKRKNKNIDEIFRPIKEEE